MLFSSSQDTIRKKLPGINISLTAYDKNDLEFLCVVEKMKVFIAR